MKGKEHFSWERDALSQSESAPGLVCEVLDTETACEKALRTFLTNAPGRRTCEGKRLVLPQVYFYKLYHLSLITQIIFTEPTGFEFSLTSVDSFYCSSWQALSQTPCARARAWQSSPNHLRTAACRSTEASACHPSGSMAKRGTPCP